MHRRERSAAAPDPPACGREDGVVAEHVLRAGPHPAAVRTGELAMPVVAANPAVPIAGEPPRVDVVTPVLLTDIEVLAQLGVWSVDVRAGRAYFSDGLRRLCGSPSGDTLSAAIDLVHPDDKPVLDLFRARLYSPTDDTPIEVELRDATGERDFRVRARSETDATGAVIRILGTVQDVTSSREFERQAILDRRLFHDAQQVARLGTWEWNTQTGECVWSTML
jgi:hypothetical protein